MPLKVRFLRKCHTEVRRGRRIIKTKQWKSRRHRRCIERRSLFANSISNLYTKRLSPNSYQESVRYTSVALCAVGTSVTLHNLRPLRDSVCLLYKTFSLSLHISEEPNLRTLRRWNTPDNRCFDNFIVNLLGAIAAYCLFPKKPCINV